MSDSEAKDGGRRRRRPRRGRRGLVLACCAVALGAAQATGVAAAAPSRLSAVTPGGGPDVAAAPIMVAKTSDGPVGYREVGHGSPLLLIMGLGGTMDNWSPSFVDGLAAHHRVVIFDNAGVGETARISSSLTITAMAAQTSALISTLGLGRPAVLGWSMGGMVAQALAVLHPSQVSRLVLAATQPGTGVAVAPAPAAQAAAASNNPELVLSVLFPRGQVAVARAYVASILSYPRYYAVPPAVKAAQNTAIAQWFAGSAAAGREEPSLRVPVLVADGTLDALDPVANDHLLVHVIKGAQLALYPGAGHGFWFQDEASFVPRVNEFLG